MAIIPCDVHINCPGSGNLEYDTPLTNFSSEAPDVDLFIGINTGWNQNLPPIGSTWSAVGCLSICESSVSQADADLCAARQEIACTVGGGNPGDNGPLTPPWLKPNGTPVQLFPNLDQSCSFTCPDGLLFTWTVAAGQVLDPNPIVANQIAFSIACRQANLHYMCLGSIGTGCLNAPYSTTISVTQGPGVLPPLSFAIISGSLPSGLVQASSQTQFFISGTPTQAGNFPFTLRVTDANGNFMQKQYILQILGITNTASLGQPISNRPFSAQLVAAGGTAPYTFSLVDSLPSGLSVNSSGLISGTVNVHYLGNFTSTFQVVDANNLKCTGVWKSNTKEPPGPDWTTLTWTTYQLNQGVPANFVAGQGSGPNAFASLVLNSNAANVSVTPVLTAGVAYTGPQVNCEMLVIVTSWDPSAQATFRPLHSVVGQLPVGGGPIVGPGTYNLTFTIPASVGATINFDDASPGNRWAFLPANMYFGTALKEAFTWQVFNV